MVFLNLFIRIIGFIYEVSLSKLLGAESMGLFQIALSTLMIFFIITNSGISTVVTKLVAEENSRKNNTNIERIYRTAFSLNLFVSIILGFILLSFSEYISIHIFKNKDMLFSVKLLFPAIIILSLSTVFKSYFYGLKDIITPGIGEVIENITKFIAILCIFYFIHPTNPVNGAMIAILGISIGEFFNLIWFIYYKLHMKKKKLQVNSKIENERSFLIKILTMSLPLTISGFFSAILRFVNTILIPSKLIVAGYTNSESIATFGRIMGMTMPLIHLPFIVTSALVINLIPSLTEQVVLNKFKDIKNDIQLSIKATLLVSIPLTAIFIVLSKSLAVFLYNDIIVANYIQIMGLSTIFFALQHNFSGILYGLNKQVTATITRLIGMIVQILLIYLLVGNPRFGILGIFISYYSSILIIMIFDILTLKRSIKLKFNYLDIVGKPLFSSIFMVLFIYITNYDLGNLQYTNALVFATSILVGALAYVFILVVTNAIPKDFFKRLLKAL